MTKLLAFDTGTERMTVAVQRGDRQWRHAGAGGAQASAALLPAILALLGEAGLTLRELDAIAFGRGPGAFTGLRTACAVAQGLAFGAGVPVLAIDTLLAVAEEARFRHGCARVLALLDARMGEVYHATYAWSADHGWQTLAEPAVCAPERLPAPPPGAVLAGNAMAVHGERLPPALRALPQVHALPGAQALLTLAPAGLTAGRAVPADQALPLYIRDKVAQTTAERAAARSAPAQTP